MNLKSGNTYMNGSYLVVTPGTELEKIDPKEKNILDELGLSAAKKKLITALNAKIDRNNQTLQELAKSSAILFGEKELSYDDYENYNPAIIGNPAGFQKAMQKKLKAPLFTDTAVSAAVTEFVDTALPVIEDEERLLDKAVEDTKQEAEQARQAYEDALKVYDDTYNARIDFYQKVSAATSGMIEDVERTPGTMGISVSLAPHTTDPVEYLRKARENAKAHSVAAPPLIPRRRGGFTRFFRAW